MRNTKIVVASCDTYSDCWEPWDMLKRRYWTEKRAALITETARRDDLYDTIAIQAPTWTERMHAALERIAEPFVIFMCDDHFIRKPVDTERIERCIDRLETSTCIATFNFERAYRPTIPFGDARKDGFGLQTPGQEYNCSCQPSIWRRETLIETLETLDGSPWDWELSEEKTIYDYYLNTGGDIIDVGYRQGQWMGIHAGKWVRADMEPLNEKEKLGINLAERGTC